jgi:short-chain fatty acids transporter
VRETSYRLKGLNYRSGDAAAYLGLGVTWAMGLSSSAAMLMATRGAIPQSLLAISGTIPLSQTIFLWPSLVTTGILMAVAVSVAYLSAPSAENARTAEDYGIPRTVAAQAVGRPSDRGMAGIQPLLSILVAGMLAAYLVSLFRNAPNGALAALI